LVLLDETLDVGQAGCDHGQPCEGVLEQFVGQAVAVTQRHILDQAKPSHGFPNEVHELVVRNRWIVLDVAVECS